MTRGCASAEAVETTPPASSMAAATQLQMPPCPVALLRKWGREDHTQVTEDLHIMMVKKHKPRHKKNVYL